MNISLLLKYIFKLKEYYQIEQLRFEIGFVLILKVILLVVIWWTFFSHPLTREARQQIVTQIIVTPSK